MLTLDGSPCANPLGCQVDHQAPAPPAAGGGWSPAAVLPVGDPLAGRRVEVSAQAERQLGELVASRPEHAAAIETAVERIDRDGIDPDEDTEIPGDSPFGPLVRVRAGDARLLVADDGFGTLTVVGVVLRPAGSVVDPSHTLTGPDGSSTPEAFL